MAPREGSQVPAFGEADLSNCEREQIHLAGSIQPSGALLVVREPDLVVVQCSLNAAAFLNVSGSLLGKPLSRIGGNLDQRIRSHLRDTLDTIPRAVRCHAGKPRKALDCLLHRPPGAGLVIELERAGEPVDLALHVEAAMQRLLRMSALKPLCDETAAIFKEVTGYDRVMVYRFDEHGHGEVFSEDREDRLEPLLGNRYPASDIPQIARQLYLRNRVRVLVDVDYVPIPLDPQLSPLTETELDMSLCFLRSMSPIHIQYLKNMGVGATLVVSLVVGGRLWGLIACHHYAPKQLHFEMRAVCEFLAEVICTRITTLESFARAQAELSVRRLEQRMIDAISRDGDWRGALFDNTNFLLSPVRATGAALLFEDQIHSVGDVPGTPQLRALGAWLESKPCKAVFSTASLGLDVPEFDDLASIASGVLATPVSSSPGEYLIWFRPEQVQTVTWGGDPMKPVILGNDPTELSPRRSFAQWHQIVEGTSEAWAPGDLAAARLIGETLKDVVIQFRSVRVLIAQDQLKVVRSQVSDSQQPVIITDEHGRVLLSNAACLEMLDREAGQLQQIEDLATCFSNADEMRKRLKDVLASKAIWRGEVHLAAAAGRDKALLVRADPVFSAPGRVLGFVLLFIDLSERKAAEVARRKFQDVLIQRHRISTVRLDSAADLVFQNLLGSVAENAQLAALEISDGDDLAQMPMMLESVKTSVVRAAEVLEQLIWHATDTADEQEN